MTINQDHNNNAPVLDTEPSLTPSTEKKPSVRVAHKSTIILWVMVLMAITVSGLALWMNQQTRQHLRELSDNRVTTLQWKNQINQFEDQVANVTQTVSELQQQLKTHVQQREQTQQWVLLKIRYLLEMAQLTAVWGYQEQSTLMLLKQADQLLARLHDPRIVAIRQTLGTEITALQQATSPDFTGLLSQLGALQKTIDTLPLKTTELKPTYPQEKPSVISASNWREHLKQSLQTLQSLIVIRHHQQPIEPLDSPEHETLVRASLQFNLQEAQWAVLHQNEAIYQLSLEQAMTNIPSIFSIDNPQAKQLLKQLTALQQTHFQEVPEPPTKTLEQLNVLLEKTA